MSGGHFDYKQFWLTEISNSIESLILNNDNQELDEFDCLKFPNFRSEILGVKFWRN